PVRVAPCARRTVQGLVPGPFKIDQAPRVIMVLQGAHTVFRQIFSDGLAVPPDPQPSRLGYSVGRWVADAFVVEPSGSTTKHRWMHWGIREAKLGASRGGFGAATSATWTCKFVDGGAGSGLGSRGSKGGNCGGPGLNAVRQTAC